ncbi:unnamed protein product [Effrenium voratum]|uniref:Acyltransferase 3 domain-containing protein n=1 Tax=Effrenium voratum TaxID=2562239 RepID=A0AA36HSL0_9DINO|nr:unnamed protein product [Effrenium voratum]CAJ1433030.1 unnamed protein product [Effrenium voratum]
MLKDGPVVFEFLTGARSLAALWILCAHYMPKQEHYSFNGALYRVNVAVNFFVVASGFVTHLSGCKADVSTWGGLMQFYVRRLGRVLLTFWLALAWSVGLMAYHRQPLEWGYLFRCACFLEQWFNWCPNGPSWFVFALLPSWLLYPATRHLVVYVYENLQGYGLGMLLGGLWMLSVGPAAFLFAAEGNITMQQHADMMFWPPAQMADFVMGMTVAEIVLRGENQRLPRLPLAADLSMLAIVLVVFLLPRPASTWALHLNGWEPLLDHGLSILMAVFIAGAVDEPTCFGQLLGHKALSSLGVMSFEVYIFQRPMSDTFDLFLDSTSMEVFLTYLLVLWSFAGLYQKYVQTPFHEWVRRRTSTWTEPAGTCAVDAESAPEGAALTQDDSEVKEEVEAS